MEAPKLEKDLWQVYKDSGLVVLGIDLRESLGAVKPWADAKNLSYSILLDKQATVWTNYSMGYIPHNVVLDSNYIVQYTDYGYNEKEILSLVQEILPVNVQKREFKTPDNFDIFVSFPNPFKDQTKILVSLAKNKSFSLKIYDLFGRLIRTITEESIFKTAKPYLWNRKDRSGKNVTSGVYFAVLTTESFNKSIKLLVLD